MMMQALTPPASFSLCAIFGKGILAAPIQNVFLPLEAVFFFVVSRCFWSASIALCQQPKADAAPQAALTPEKALALANKGAVARACCSQACADQPTRSATRKEIGVVGVRCSLAVDDRDSTLTLSLSA